MRSKKDDHPSPARSYCSGDMRPRCSKCISVRPSPRSVRTTLTSSYASSPDWSDIVSTSRSGSTTSRYSPFHWISPRAACMVRRQEPPCLTSIETLDSGTSNSVPPNQSAKRSGSVHSFHTRSRDASNTRVIVIPASAAAPGVPGSATRGSLLGRSQAGLELVEAALPEGTVTLQPLDRVLERCPLQPRRPKLRRPAPGDQSRALQHLAVVGDCLRADRERLGQLVHRRLALGESPQDRPPRRVGEGREGVRELVGWHVLFSQALYQTPD